MTKTEQLVLDHIDAPKKIKGWNRWHTKALQSLHTQGLIEPATGGGFRKTVKAEPLAFTKIELGNITNALRAWAIKAGSPEEFQYRWMLLGKATQMLHQ